MGTTRFTTYFTSCKGVFQGGGCKAIAYIGAYKKAYERGVFFSELAGTSAGSVIAALIAAGAKPNYLEELAYNTDFNKFISPNKTHKFCWIYKICLPKSFKKSAKYLSKETFQEFGVFNPKEIEDFLNENLKKLTGLDRDVKFKDLIPDLHIVCADLKLHSIKIWDKEHTPDASVAKAVCASCCIPVFFQPIDKQYVDGGVLSNLPNFLFTEEPHYNRILCFKLKSSDTNKNIETLCDYISALINTIVEGASDIQQLLLPGTHDVTIQINGISATDFHKLNKTNITQLMKEGEKAMNDFLNDELTFSPTVRNKASSFILSNKEQMRSLMSYISLEEQKEIYISSKDTYWSWELFLSIVRWIKNKSKVVVLVSSTISPQYKDSELARRRMLRAMGCNVIETEISTCGYFFKKSKHWKGIVFQDGSEEFMGQFYNSSLDNLLIKEWIFKLEKKIEDNASASFTSSNDKLSIQLHPVDENEIITRLKREPIYENAQFSFETISLDQLLFLNPYIRALKYKQIDCLFDFYNEKSLSPFSPAAFKFHNGKDSLIGPPVIEEHNNKFYIIEGNTRCVYAYRHGLKSLRVLVVRNVNEEIPCETQTVYNISQILISDKKVTANNRYRNFDYDKFRHIEESLRPYKEYML